MNWPKMRRNEKEISDKTEIESIIKRSVVCRLAMADGKWPYVVPLCFGYKDNALFFHSAQEGYKLEVLKKNNRVCFEFDIDRKTKPSEKPCEWAMQYQSVIGFGRATVLEDRESKMEGLDIIFRQYSRKNAEYPEASLESTAVIKVDIEQMTAKRS